MTLTDEAIEMFIDGMKAAQGVSIVINALTETGRQTATLTGWIGRKAFATNKQTGPRVEFSERDFFLVRADIEEAGLPAPAKDWTLRVEGEADTYKVSGPSTGEPAVVFSDQQKKIYRIHTKKWESS